MAGVDAKHPDPVPGFSYYQRDPATKGPTGSLVETVAMQELNNKLEPMSPDRVVAAATDLLPHFATYLQPG